MKTQQFTSKSAQSQIDWFGRKVTGPHNGITDVKAGTLIFNDDQLAGGQFVIDTQSIQIFDINDPATNAQFSGHLASDDFFSSEQFPEATLEMYHIEPRQDGSYHIEGDLTIKGVTHTVGLDAQVAHVGDAVTATGRITVDRTKYNMMF